jgi:uncharacterized protein involved in response to NO
MTDHPRVHAGRREAALFSYGFRPFFLGAAVLAGLAIPTWIALLTMLDDATWLGAARAWHVHEMVFGFLPAVITGFVLTAIPNWTDRPPISGRTLMGLWSLWLAGRLVMAGPWLPFLLAAMIDAAFLMAVTGLVWREIAAGASWSHAPIGGVISLYAGANLWFHVLALSGASTGTAWRMGVALIMILLVLVGGRLTPTFTGEFLSRRHPTVQPASFSPFDGLAIALVAIAAVAWVIEPDTAATGWLLAAAGLVNVGRLARWYGWLTWPEPLVLMLHLGYGWLAVGLFLWGGATLGFGLPITDALHALTTGSVGAMTLAVMTRASLGHTGRPRQADPLTVLIYVLVNLGAILRVFGPSFGGVVEPVVLSLAAASWSGAYLLFALVYGPYLLSASLDESDS